MSEVEFNKDDVNYVYSETLYKAVENFLKDLDGECIIGYVTYWWSGMQFQSKTHETLYDIGFSDRKELLKWIELFNGNLYKGREKVHLYYVKGRKYPWEYTPENINGELPKRLKFKGYQIFEADEQITVVYELTKKRNEEACRNHLQYIYFDKCIKRIQCCVPKWGLMNSVEKLLKGLNKDVDYLPGYNPSKNTVHLFLGEGLTENKYIKDDGSIISIIF